MCNANCKLQASKSCCVGWSQVSSACGTIVWSKWRTDVSVWIDIHTVGAMVIPNKNKKL